MAAPTRISLLLPTVALVRHNARDLFNPANLTVLLYSTRTFMHNRKRVRLQNIYPMRVYCKTCLRAQILMPSMCGVIILSYNLRKNVVIHHPDKIYNIRSGGGGATTSTNSGSWTRIEKSIIRTTVRRYRRKLSIPLSSCHLTILYRWNIKIYSHHLLDSFRDQKFEIHQPNESLWVERLKNKN